jgi:anaphase-promoting complex subunit 7
LIAKCFLECKLVNEAVQTLQSLTNKQRTPKINMLLAKTLNDNGKPSMLFYKEVLKECPLAFEAIDGLLNLRVKGSEVNSLVLSASQNCGDWLNNWIKAISQMKERKFDEAIKTLKAIESSSYLKNYSLLLVLIGECHYYNGHYELAYNHLKRAYSLDRNMKRGIQKYAMLLFQLNKVQELEQLVKPLSNFPYEHSTEMWFILAQYLLASGKPEKAIYIVDKACQLDKQNVDAILLKSRIYLQMKKPADALINLRHALKLDCMRYEIHKGIIEVFLSIDKKKEAQQQATAALKHVGESPRTLTVSYYFYCNFS